MLDNAVLLKNTQKQTHEAKTMSNIKEKKRQKENKCICMTIDIRMNHYFTRSPGAAQIKEIKQPFLGKKQITLMVQE